MDTSAFYRKDVNGEFQCAQNFVYGPGYELHREGHDKYTYPTKGDWRWFDDIYAACKFYNEDPEKWIPVFFPSDEGAPASSRT